MPSAGDGPPTAASALLYPGALGVGLLIAALPSPAAAGDGLGDAETVASIVEHAATVIALIVGGIFAYYTFIKDRIYRPWVQVDIAAGRVKLGADDTLLCRVILKNLGSTKLGLLHDGMAVKVYTSEPPEGDHRFLEWKRWAVGDVLFEHDWLEAHETVSDDVLLRVPPDRDVAYLVRAEIVVKQRRQNVTVIAQRIVPAILDWKEADASGGPEPHGPQAGQGAPAFGA